MAMQTNGLYNWVAENSNSQQGYICEARCLKGYRWHNLVKKCLMVKHLPEDERTLPEAMKMCSESGGKMVTAKNCYELDVLKNSLATRENVPGFAKITIGLFVNGLEKAHRRRSGINDSLIDS
jgi:hypothetical protein